MKRRIIASIVIIAILSLALVACAKESYSFTGKTYIYTSLINDGSFTITINENGTYQYSVPSYHVNITGEWEYENDILSLIEPTEDEYYMRHNFRIDGENLAYVAEGSSGFPFATINDGDLFVVISSDTPQ